MSPAAREPWLAAAILAFASAGVVATQPRLAQEVHAVKERDDVSVLPPPNELRALALGYDAAMVDLLWAKLLVDYGMHWQEKRPLDVTPYFDGILALEPSYAPLYHFADTLIVYKPPHGDADDARTARRYLERGLKERPYDRDVWQQFGQFTAFLGPSFLTSDTEKEQWRKDGAFALARAVELGADTQRTLSAATVLTKTGEREAAITYLRRAYALTDDPQMRDEIAFKLDRLEASSVKDEAERQTRYIEGLWRRDFFALARGEFLLLGLPRDPLRCAGLPAFHTPEACPRNWDDALRGSALNGGR